MGTPSFLVTWGLEKGQVQYRSQGQFDSSDGHEYFPCRDACYELNRGHGYHASCLRIFAPEPTNRLEKILQYTFEPSPAAENRRFRWLQNQLVSATEESVPLPPEVRANVAQHLLPEYAAARNISLGRLSDSRSLVKVTTPIEASYVTFEGVPYLDTLTNKTELPNNWVPPRVLYVAYERLGIRKLIFSSSNDSPKVNSVPGVWWETLPLSGQNGALQCFHDGLKLTVLRYIDEAGKVTPIYRSVFSTPQSPTVKHRHVQFCRTTNLAMGRLLLFQYNRPEITGFSICCNPAPVSFHAHTSEDDLLFYDSAPHDSTWVYAPLNENERIVNIWMRATTLNQMWLQSDTMKTIYAMRFLSREDLAKREVALVFQTSQGRMLLFGGQWSRDLPHHDWTLLDAPDGKLGHFFFDTNPTYTPTLSFDTERPTTADPVFDLPGVPEASSPHPSFQSSDGFFWSSASVEDVTGVRPCRLDSKIVGLLFSYLDGSSAAIGQVRLDHLDALLKRVDGGKLCLGFTRTTENCPYIARVEMLAEKSDGLVKGQQDSVDMWFEVSWSGTIEWWHSHRQCQVWQDGRQSLDIAILPPILPGCY
ncbi:hypothetical protein MRS44_007133 [Fusarium solani]|uniref:uncharacterized protein n=1 Tax=Fusarium solani TaxID=169388 RepID=UPI0032C48709|nr:hypothetical protein MRS44_007133 [Fusarium solani]